MASDEPINPEDEYFLKLDMARIKGLRHKLDKSREEESELQRMKTHWMKCPKCGSDLEEINHGDVKIDQCGKCKGIWLDQGELELLTRGKAEFSEGFFQKLFG